MILVGLLINIGHWWLKFQNIMLQKRKRHSKVDSMLLQEYLKLLMKLKTMTYTIVYIKYFSLVVFLTTKFEEEEFDNVLSEEEMKKFVHFDVVLDKQKALEKQFE